MCVDVTLLHTYELLVGRERQVASVDGRRRWHNAPAPAARENKWGFHKQVFASRTDTSTKRTSTSLPVANIRSAITSTLPALQGDTKCRAGVGGVGETMLPNCSGCERRQAIRRTMRVRRRKVSDQLTLAASHGGGADGKPSASRPDVRRGKQGR